MFRTRLVAKMASTHRGQRRILKYKGTVANYLRQSVNAGTYRTNDELAAVWRERRESAEDLKTVMYRFRQNIVRGTSIHDYPIEYQILTQYPPLPDPPRTPVKLLRQNRAKPNPLRPLVQAELKRQAKDSDDGTMTADEYYERLLGIRKPDESNAMGNKSAAMQKAYTVAVKQYQLQRTKGLSEHDALQQVDALLAESNAKEQANSSKTTRQVQEESEEIQTWRQSTDATESPGATQHGTTPAVLSGQTTVADGMMRWSERLQAVPYRQWTLGASTALDHWIASQILGLSEETWASLLEGTDADLLSCGRDVIVTRQALFPETLLEEQEAASLQQEEQDRNDLAAAAEEQETVNEEPVESSGEKSIEELLMSLGGLQAPSAEDETETEASSKVPSSTFTWKTDDDDAQYGTDIDAKVDKLMDELQEWRRRNVASPYEVWSKDDKDHFQAWMRTYVDTLMPEAIGVDYASTQDALLSQPPVTRQESAAFWDALKDQGRAHELLEQMRSDGPPAGASILHQAFWDLSYDEQLKRLLRLGALRPLLDEYASESGRRRFLERHGDTLLQGVELEHLVEDESGPIRYDDLDGTTADALGIDKSARFRLQVLPYQSSNGEMSAQETTRALFTAWNEFKAGRARYEEKMFQTGRLGLRYSDKIPDENEDDSDDNRIHGENEKKDKDA